MKRNYSKHGMTGTKIHEVWKEMNRRCKDKNIRSVSYKKKDISVCEGWKTAKTFIDWALLSGYKEGLQIDRINNDEGYFPSNCRWVTPKQNANNKSNTIRLTFNGKTQTLEEWSNETEINKRTIYTRMIRGWSTKDILTRRTQCRKKVA